MQVLTSTVYRLPLPRCPRQMPIGCTAECACSAARFESRQTDDIDGDVLCPICLFRLQVSLLLYTSEHREFCVINLGIEPCGTKILGLGHGSLVRVGRAGRNIEFRTRSVLVH